mmetsp:Transcript_40785/g.53730  ORF Transcript_40785/g.53730 Transcript_40785/m.53730 type:complete len:100 (+) Transcript_40785:1112-1411(+)
MLDQYQSSQVQMVAPVTMNTKVEAPQAGEGGVQDLDIHYSKKDTRISDDKELTHCSLTADKKKCIARVFSDKYEFKFHVCSKILINNLRYVLLSVKNAQ